MRPAGEHARRGRHPSVVDITATDGTGTEFVIDTDGHILTAAHVVEGSQAR